MGDLRGRIKKSLSTLSRVSFIYGVFHTFFVLPYTVSNTRKGILNMINQRFNPIISALRGRPSAFAHIYGKQENGVIRGTVYFYQTPQGVIVLAEVSGLPLSSDPCDDPFFAFHIHEGMSCQGTAGDPFGMAMGHYNPKNCPHPCHAGDLPPLISASGIAMTAFLCDSFAVRDIIGKTVIIHSGHDDFTTQPSGNSGTKIACGTIVRAG